MMDLEILSWRRQQRARLLAARQSISLEERRRVTGVIVQKLDIIVTALSGVTIGLYWPIKTEIDIIAWAAALAEKSDRCLCLPVVVTPKSPLEYWRWTPGDAMARGFWNIPVPARRDVVQPDLMLAPLVGFDRRKYRLGYGGGYFDRTLGSLQRRPTVIGIGYGFSALDTIFPQPHDIPMDAILTERHDPPPDRRIHDTR